VKDLEEGCQKDGKVRNGLVAADESLQKMNLSL
jgi:hypothetical protein